MSLSLASLHIYPIKSLGGFAVKEALLTDRGFQHDRRWMLVDETDRFLTQRSLAEMACLHCSPNAEGFRVTDLRDGDAIDLPWTHEKGEEMMATVWEDTVPTIRAAQDISSWFSSRLGQAVELVHMPASSKRPVDPNYAKGVTSLSDGFPYLIISQASLDDLNARMKAPLPMERFRPNLVIAGGIAFQEDAWKEVTVGSARFSLVKPCARCVITTTDQRTGDRGSEPLRTLATYRSTGNKVMFGMNAVGDATVLVRVGDHVTVLDT